MGSHSFYQLLVLAVPHPLAAMTISVYASEEAPPALSHLSAQTVFHYALKVYTGYILLSACNRFIR